VSGDDHLETIEAKLFNCVGKETRIGEKIDTWVELIANAREEDYYDKKYWAFLNGYLNLKMAQLLENEMSIIDSSVKLYICDLKKKKPETKLDESIGVGKFLSILKDEPEIIVGFTLF
jgi:hypothetical protein